MRSEDAQWKVFVLLLKKIAEQKGISFGEIEEKSGVDSEKFFNLSTPPRFDHFLKVAKAIQINFFIEDREGKTELNKLFESAMEYLGRRPDKFPKN